MEKIHPPKYKYASINEQPKDTALSCVYIAEFILMKTNSDLLSKTADLKM
jgi:hypothetical protein